MKIDELLKKELVFLDVEASDKMAAIDFLADKMSVDEGMIDIERFKADLVQREDDIPTGLEHGCAIPHARSRGVSRLVLSFARLKKGVDFGCQDNEPASLIFQFGIPPDQISVYLKILAKLSRLLKKSDLREALLTAGEPADIIEVFSGK